MFEEAENSYKSQIKILEEDVERQKVRYLTMCDLVVHLNISKRLLRESMLRSRKEQELMLSSLHSLMMERTRDHLVKQPQQQRGPNSWLGQQRKNVSVSYKDCQKPC